MPLGLGYTKTWNPIYKPQAVLASMRGVWKDIHDNLISSGAWIQTADAGQIDLDTVTVPAVQTDAGFKIYKFVDPWDAMGQIFMRVTFGRYNTPGWTGNGSGIVGGLSIKVQVSSDTNFTPSNTTWGAYPRAYRPASLSGSNWSLYQGRSYLCSNTNLGFFGMVYGVGSWSIEYLNSPLCTFAVFIQRNLDDNQNVIPGFTSYSNSTYVGNNNTTSLSTIMATALIGQRFNGPTYKDPAINYDHSIRPFSNKTGVTQNGTLQVCPIFTMTPQVKQIPTMVSYNVNHMAEGTVFQAQIISGYPMKYIALGNSFGLYTGIDASIAMLYQ